jgi:hypothetical protein
MLLVERNQFGKSLRDWLWFVVQVIVRIAFGNYNVLVLRCHTAVNLPSIAISSKPSRLIANDYH